MPLWPPFELRPMSESVNKEAAEACAVKGATALSSGDAATAVRLLQKALRLYDLGPDTRAALERAQALAADASPSAQSYAGASSPVTPAAASPRADGVRFRGEGGSGGGGLGSSGRGGAPGSVGGASSTPANPRVSTSSGGGASSASGGGGGSAGASGRPYTAAQAELVRALRARKDFYELLGVERTADEDAINRAYKQLARKIHPDKNTAPGAEEIFKRVENAKQVLLNPQERAHYDRYGESGAGGAGTGAAAAAAAANPFGHHRHGFGGGGVHFQQVDPADIFAAFFGGGFPGGVPGGVHFRTGGGGGVRGGGRGGGGGNAARGGEGEAEATARNLWQLLPMLLFFVLMLWNIASPDRPDDVFALKRSSTFSERLVTRNAPNVEYFVAPSTARINHASPLFHNLEARVLEVSERTWLNDCAFGSADACERLEKYFPHQAQRLQNRRASRRGF